MRSQILIVSSAYGIIIGALILHSGPQVVTAAYGVDVTLPIADLIVVAAYATVQFLGLALVAGLTASRDFRAVLLNSAIMLGIVTAVAWPLTSIWGLTGAFLSNLIAASASAFLATYRLRAHLRAS